MTFIQKLKNPKLLIFIGLMFVCVAVVVYTYLQTNRSGSVNKPNEGDLSKVASVSVFKSASKPIYLPPLKISFNEKELDVEEVGVEGDGALGVPGSWHTAGWYKKGSKPGEEGNVIIDGHYDTNTGAPGAFWELKNLQVGDRVFLTDSLGRVFEYSVDNTFFVNISDPERVKVLESGSDKILTLITCGGVWDYKSGTYNKRFVVTAVFDKMEKAW